MKYRNYPLYELEEIRSRPRSVASDPYKLFVAMVLTALEELDDSSEMDEESGTNVYLWGKSFPKSDVDSIIDDCILEFCHAVGYKMKLDIGGTLYSLRNLDKINPGLIKHIFAFPHNGTETTISPDGIYDVSSPVNDHDTFDSNKNFTKQVWYLGSSSEEGWYDLTDMEAAVFCWIQYARRIDTLPPFSVWYEKYSKFIDVPFEDIKQCLSNTSGTPKTVFSFSADKVEEYNKAHNALSKVSTVSLDEAERYWNY